MDIQHIRFNQELFKNKVKLENKLEMINNEIKTSQESCNHVCVVSGYTGSEYTRNDSIKECLFCRTKEFDNDTKYPTIYGYTYKKRIYGNGESESDREQRIIEILDLWIKIQEQYPNDSIERIAERVDAEIYLDEQKNQIIEKNLKY